MEAKIQKWGNSEGIRIPHNIIKELHLKTNDIVDIKQKGNQIIITKLKFLCKKELIHIKEKICVRILFGMMHKVKKYGKTKSIYSDEA